MYSWYFLKNFGVHSHFSAVLAQIGHIFDFALCHSLAHFAQKQTLPYVGRVTSIMGDSLCLQEAHTGTKNSRFIIGRILVFIQIKDFFIGCF